MSSYSYYYYSPSYYSYTYTPSSYSYTPSSYSYSYSPSSYSSSYKPSNYTYTPSSYSSLYDSYDTVRKASLGYSIAIYAAVAIGLLIAAIVICSFCCRDSR